MCWESPIEILQRYGCKDLRSLIHHTIDSDCQLTLSCTVSTFMALRHKSGELTSTEKTEMLCGRFSASFGRIEVAEAGLS